MKTFPLAKTFQLLEPGPVVWVSTAHRGRANLMSMSWHMMMTFRPPLIACILGPWDFSYRALRATRECVIAIPTVDLAAQVVDIGNCSGEDVDKFETFGLTPVKGRKVKAPLVAECLANIECVVEDTRLLNRYSLWVLRAVKAWHDPQRKERRTLHHVGDGTFRVDGRTLDLSRHMV